jgi:TatD DNase family protein
VHLDFFKKAHDVAREAEAMNLHLFANTVMPEGFVRVRELIGGMPNVSLGLGAHPWWAREIDFDLFDRLASQTPWIGEVGLDFSPKRKDHGLQQEVFTHIAEFCADSANKVLSIHSVRSAGTVLDILEQTGCANSCRCIFHWFNGSTDDLWRAIRMGCWFSINEMQAGTRRAKEQLTLIPSDRMLLETDLPPSESSCASATDIVSSLERTLTQIEVIRNESVRKQVTYNWDTILLDA